MIKRLTLLALLAAPVAQAQTLTVELNKLEDVDNGCQAYFLFRNDRPENLTGFQMSLAILSPDGIIDRLLTIDAAPLPANRTTLKLFEIPDTQCGNIGQVLLHDIPACTPQNGDPEDCFSFLELNSRAAAPLVK
jgi:hypothetical protein